MDIEVNITEALIRMLYGVKKQPSIKQDCKAAKVHKDYWPCTRKDGIIIEPTPEQTPWVMLERVRKNMNTLFSQKQIPTRYEAKFRHSCDPCTPNAPHSSRSHD